MSRGELLQPGGLIGEGDTVGSNVLLIILMTMSLVCDEFFPNAFTNKNDSLVQKIVTLNLLLR